MAEPTATTDAGDGGGTTATETRTFSQEDVDRIVGDRLARERAGFADYDDLKQKASKFDELDQASKTEAQRLTEERDGLKSEVGTWQSKALRFEAASKAGLDLQFAPRIQGSTAEEMEADAKQLAEQLKPAGPNPSQFDGGARTSATDTSFDGLIRRKASG